MGRDSGVLFHTNVADVQLPAPIALLLYQIAREGVMNALKHAHATDMWITVTEDAESIEFELRDNGRGFDTTAPGPEGHYGMAMMRERAQVGGGSSSVTSVIGEGTTINVRFPTSLLQQESDPAAARSRRGSPRRAGDRCFPRYIWNHRAGGRTFSRARPSIVVMRNAITPQ